MNALRSHWGRPFMPSVTLLGFLPLSYDKGLSLLCFVYLSIHASDVLSYLVFANFDTKDFDSIFGFQGTMHGRIL